MLKSRYHSWLVPYLEGTLDDRRRARLEARLAKDSALAAEAEALRWTLAHLRVTAAEQRAEASPETARPSPDLWPRVRARIEPRSPARRAMPVRLRWAGGLCAAGALAAAAIFAAPKLSPAPHSKPVLAPAAPVSQVNPPPNSAAMPADRIAKNSLPAPSRPANPSKSASHRSEPAAMNGPDPFARPGMPAASWPKIGWRSGTGEKDVARKPQLAFNGIPPKQLHTPFQMASRYPNPSFYGGRRSDGSSLVPEAQPPSTLSLRPPVVSDAMPPTASPSSRSAAGPVMIANSGGGSMRGPAAGTAARKRGGSDGRLPPSKPDVSAAPLASSAPYNQAAVQGAEPKIKRPEVKMRTEAAGSFVKVHTPDEVVSGQAQPLPEAADASSLNVEALRHQLGRPGVPASERIALSQRLALAYAAEGRTRQSLDYWQSALEQTVRPPLYGDEAGAQQGQQVLQEARGAGALEALRAQLERRRRQRPSDLVLGRLLATLYDFTGDQSQARAERQRVVATGAASAEDWFQLAQADERAGDQALAQQAYRQVLATAGLPLGSPHRVLARQRTQQAGP